MLAHPGIFLLRCLALLPLPVLRALGWLLGWLLFALARSRRRVAMTNLALCFPRLTRAQRRRLTQRSFVCFAQAWLDRAWLWHGSAACTLRRLRLSGEVQALQGDAPAVIFSPHFVGLDAGWTALTQRVPRRFTTIFTNQSNPVLNDWVLRGRQRFGRVKLFDREDGVKTIVAALRAGDPLYLLPDMNYGPAESIFVPFYGQAAATVPSLSRFARLGRAQVIPVVTRMTRSGYDVEVMLPWVDYPTDDVVADTALMNRRLQDYIDTMPEQYFWVHKRFKTRPAGEPPVY
jgi:KDO2-lipid IV(A) lauroyltransferase